MFEIQDLHVSVDGHEILKGVDLKVGAGEIHALMGPNGSGKSTLANALLGNPEYQVTSGHIVFQGDDITDWPTDVRAKAGLFLAFQYPEEVPGVPVIQFAEIINRITGNPAGIVFEDRRIPGDPQQRRPDIARARAVLGWEPQVSLEDGLRDTIGYFRGRV